MISDISDKDIAALFQKACEEVEEFPKTYSTPAALITNSKSDVDKIAHIMDKVLNRKLNLNGSDHNTPEGIATMDWIPINTFYLLPEPEFLGVVSVNLGGFGAMLFSETIFEFRL